MGRQVFSKAPLHPTRTWEDKHHHYEHLPYLLPPALYAEHGAIWSEVSQKIISIPAKPAQDHCKMSCNQVLFSRKSHSSLGRLYLENWRGSWERPFFFIVLLLLLSFVATSTRWTIMAWMIVPYFSPDPGKKRLCYLCENLASPFSFKDHSGFFKFKLWEP